MSPVALSPRSMTSHHPTRPGTLRPFETRVRLSFRSHFTPVVRCNAPIAIGLRTGPDSPAKPRRSVPVRSRRRGSKRDRLRRWIGLSGLTTPEYAASSRTP